MGAGALIIGRTFLVPVLPSNLVHGATRLITTCRLILRRRSNGRATSRAVRAKSPTAAISSFGPLDVAYFGCTGLAMKQICKWRRSGQE
ncbi:hypothetical protein IWX49DRAFT_9968 [Phyllosticta citricarpa]